MNKTELIEKLAERTDAPRAEAQRHFEAFEDIVIVTETLKGGGEVRITGFEEFYVQERKAREGTNPQTGKKMQIPASKSPAFNSGNAFKEFL